MRKFMLLICFAILLLTMFHPVNTVDAQSANGGPITTQPIGDYTNDGNVNSADVVAMINMYYGGFTVNSGPFVDLYSDDSFTLEDIHILIGFVQGRVPTLPVYPCTSENTQYPDPYTTPVISINGLPWVALPCFSLYQTCAGAACMVPPENPPQP